MKTDANGSGEPPSLGVLLRCVVAGVFMGLANLVPGISGGTMLVAAGVYRRFIDAVSDVSRLRLRMDALATLAAVVAGAVVAIAAGSGFISYALTHWRWAAYSLFIGLTMGGAPILWRMLRPINRHVAVGLAVGFVAMLAVGLLQSGDTGGGGTRAGLVYLLIAGIVGASAMILPGISGAYLLLLLGVYETVIDAIKDAVQGAREFNLDAVWSQMGVLIPVGVGVLIGVAGVSNILRMVLHRYEKVTIAVLLGLLLAAPAGLYPFVDGVQPVPGDILGGETVTAENLDSFGPKDWRQQRFTPTPLQVGGALGMFALGLALTLGVARLGGDESEE